MTAELGRLQIAPGHVFCLAGYVASVLLAESAGKGQGCPCQKPHPSQAGVLQANLKPPLC